MKKKITKKLELSKETLRNLSPVDLKVVAGGTMSGTSCDYTCENELDTPTRICG